LIESPRARAPNGAQLEIGEALEPFVRAAEILLQRVDLLLGPHRRAFLELQPVEQAMTLVVDRSQFLLELGPVPEQRDETLVLHGGFTARQAIDQLSQGFRQGVHALLRQAARRSTP
jgi:hypothetical protein